MSKDQDFDYSDDANPRCLTDIASNYKPFNTEGWDNCNECQGLPKVWHFDNGLLFKCRCQHRLDPAAIHGQSSWHYYKEHETTKGWSLNNYKDDWNEFARREI